MYAEKYLLQQTYGLSLAEYAVLLKTQDGKCAICGVTPGERDKRLCVDHDHKTGEIRGLLCNGCNWSLGGFRDSADLLRRAAIYLETHSQKREGIGY